MRASTRPSLISASSLLAIGLVGAGLAACSEAPATPLDAEERATLFGADATMAVLADDWGRLPVSVPEFETRFALGRACARLDSREIYLMEERSSRFGGVQRAASALLPRVVITGCAASRPAESLMLAVTSPVDPHDPTDTLALAPVEVMSWVAERGEYAFYELLERDGRPSLIRLEQQADGQVIEYEKTAGQPLQIRAATGPRCFGCHVHGEPMLNELSDPWFDWVSSAKPRASRRDYTGVTGAMVAEAEGGAGRVSQASDLEVTVRRGIGARVPERGPGLGERVDPQLWRVSFCPSSFQLATRGHRYPEALFVDAVALRAAGMAFVPPQQGLAAAEQVPVRSLVDARIENALVARGQLDADSVLAVHLVDDLRDVSALRCGLWASLPQPLPSTPTELRAAVHALLRPHVDATPRGAYLAALLDAQTSERATLAAAYREDLDARLQQRAATLEQWLPGEVAARWQIASAELDRPENPLPPRSP